MENRYFDLGDVFERTRAAWLKAMTVGGDFSIADALGADETVSLLQSKLGAMTTIQGAVAGIVDAVADKPVSVQRDALEQSLPFTDSAGLHVRTRDIAAASRWIAAALESKLSGAPDPISAIQDEMTREILGAQGEQHLLDMSCLLAAVTLIGAIANFPNDPPTSNKSVVEWDKIAAAASTGTISVQNIQYIINGTGSIVNVGGVHGQNNNVIQGNNNVVASGQNNSSYVGAAAPASAQTKEQSTNSFWRNPKFYAWLSGFVLAALTLYFTWLGVTQG